MKPIQSFAVILFLFISAPHSFADTAQEIRDVVEANMAFTNKNLSQDPMRISSGGSKEFFSGSVKHIEVVVLVEGKAAIAHYYQEAAMKPKGLPAVPNYRTRVTQAYVKEDGMWRVKAAHWSPLQGGAGTSQTVVK